MLYLHKGIFVHFLYNLHVYHFLSTSLPVSPPPLSLSLSLTHSLSLSLSLSLCLYVCLSIWLRPTKSGPVGLKKLTFHTFHHVQYNGCFKHMNYRLSMSIKPCHTIFFSFRMVGLQSWVLRVTKSSRCLRYPQYTSHFLCFYHVQSNTYNLL